MTKVFSAPIASRFCERPAFLFQSTIALLPFYENARQSRLPVSSFLQHVRYRLAFQKNRLLLHIPPKLQQDDLRCDVLSPSDAGLPLPVLRLRTPKPFRAPVLLLPCRRSARSFSQIQFHNLRPSLQ